MLYYTHNRKVGKYMIFFTKIMDRMGYEAKDELFMREFIRENERVFAKFKFQYDGKRRYDEIRTFNIDRKDEERYLRIKRLENAINQRSTMIKIKVEENGILVMKKE